MAYHLLYLQVNSEFRKKMWIMKKIVGLSVILLVFWLGTALGKTSLPLREIEGTVKEIRTEKASPRARFGFMTAVLSTGKGEVKVRLYPEWWRLKPPFTVGHRIRVRGWIPPRMAFKGQAVLVAAEIRNLDTGEVLVLREGPGRPRWISGLKPQTFSGEIVARRISPGLGRPQIKWLVIEVKNESGQLYTFRISPLWLNDYPELQPGMRVKITAWRPPFWRARNIQDYMACRVFLPESGKTLNLRKCPTTK